MKKQLFPVIAFACILLAGCSTYKISIQSLAGQLKETAVEGKGYIVPESVQGNDLTSLEGVDKNGQPHVVQITNRTGIRITKTDNSKTTFYANTVLLKDSSLLGSKTHFFKSSIHPIPLKDISSIEILP